MPAGREEPEQEVLGAHEGVAEPARASTLCPRAALARSVHRLRSRGIAEYRLWAAWRETPSDSLISAQVWPARGSWSTKWPTSASLGLGELAGDRRTPPPAGRADSSVSAASSTAAMRSGSVRGRGHLSTSS